MNKLLIKLLLIFSMLLSGHVFAGAYTNWAVPSTISIVGADGFRVMGEFGNANNCDTSDQVFVRSNHPQYKEIYAMVLNAYTSKKSIRVYIGSCDVISWISASSLNVLTTNGSQVDIKD